MPVTKHFLLVYDLRRHRLRQWEEFDFGDEAAAAYSQVEAEYRDHADDFEVALLRADSLDAIKITHRHYFSAVMRDSLGGYLQAATGRR
jgi:hypothetical protein